MEIPSFLIEMSKQINEQDNRCTADPVWQVRCKRTRVTDREFTDLFEFIDSDNHIVAATNVVRDDDLNQQIIDYLQVDFDDLPIVIEKWVDHYNFEGEKLSGEGKVEFFLDNFDMEVHELDDFNLYWVEQYEEIVKSAFLTQQDAEWFINRKQHDYPKLYTYVESMYHCPQMIELRNWIKGLCNG